MNPSNELRKTLFREFFVSVMDILSTAAIGLIIMFVTLGVFLASNVVIRGWQDQCNTRFNEVNTLSASLSSLYVKNQQLSNESRYASTPRLDKAHVDADDIIASAVFNELFTHSNVGSSSVDLLNYSKSVSAQYGVAKSVVDSVFYDYLHVGNLYSSTCSEFQSVVTNVASDSYQYVAFIGVDSEKKATEQPVDEYSTEETNGEADAVVTEPPVVMEYEHTIYTVSYSVNGNTVRIFSIFKIVI